MEEIKKVISIETKGSNSIKGLKNQIKDLKKELESLEIGTEEYERSLNKLSQAQKKYNEINADLRQRSITQQRQFVNLAEFSEGLGKSFTALTGIVGMLGSENEDLNKILGKVAYSLQIIGGLDGITKLARQLPNIKNQFKDWAESLGLVNRRIKDIAKTDLSKVNAGGAGTAGGTVTAASGIIKKGDVDNIKNYNTEVERQNTFFGQNKQARSEQIMLMQRQIINNDKIIAQNEANVKLATDLSKKEQAEIKNLTELIDLQGKRNNGTILTTSQLTRLKVLTNKYGSDISQLNKSLTEHHKRLEQNNNAISLGERAINKASESTNLLTANINKLTKTGPRVLKFFNTVGATVGWTVLIGGILAALGALWKWISGLKSAAKEQRELNKAIKEGTAQIASQGVVVLKELAYAYQKVGDTAEEKKKFIEQYKDKIAETGIAIDTVEKAEDVFVKNTDKYVEALMARAKAQAIENKAIELYEEYLTKRAKLESKRKYSKDKKLANDLVAAGIMTPEEADLVGGKTQKKIDKLESEINSTLKRLFEDVADINTEWNGFWAGMTATVETNTDEATKALEDAKKRDLELLAQYQDEALMTQMSAMDRELAELADKYKERLDLARKYGEDETQIREAWKIEQQEILDRYEQEALDKEKEAVERRLQEIDIAIERIRREGETSNLKEPREQTFQSKRKMSVISAVFGLGYGYGKDTEYTYQTKEDQQKQLEAQITYNNAVYEITKSRIEQENALLEEKLQMVQAGSDEEYEILRRFTENEMALSDARLDNEEANTKAYKEYQEERRESLQRTLSVASSISGALASLWEADTAEHKVFAIAQATIDTFMAANSVLAQQQGGLWAKIAAMAAVITAGIANVVSIISVKPDKGYAGASASVPAPAALNVAPVEYTRNLLGDKETEMLNNPVKCYVLESDITNAQSKVQVTESGASF